MADLNLSEHHSPESYKLLQLLQFLTPPKGLSISELNSTPVNATLYKPNNIKRVFFNLSCKKRRKNKRLKERKERMVKKMFGLT